MTTMTTMDTQKFITTILVNNVIDFITRYKKSVTHAHTLKSNLESKIEMCIDEFYDSIPTSIKNTLIKSVFLESLCHNKVPDYSYHQSIIDDIKKTTEESIARKLKILIDDVVRDNDRYRNVYDLYDKFITMSPLNYQYSRTKHDFEQVFMSSQIKNYRSIFSLIDKINDKKMITTVESFIRTHKLFCSMLNLFIKYNTMIMSELGSKCHKSISVDIEIFKSFIYEI